MTKENTFGHFVLCILLLGSGCASPKNVTFDFDNPSSVVARAWWQIEHGYAREEGNFKRADLKLSMIDYSNDGKSVEISFYVIGSFKTDANGRLTYKLLDIDMDRKGRFISAATADGSRGVPSPIGF
jgi:hypothetical protein